MYHIEPQKLLDRSYQMLDLTGKNILLRTCLNVTTDKEGTMLDRTRFDEALPLIKEIAPKVAKLVITAHLGRPTANESEFSFSKIVKNLEEALGMPVTFVTKLEDLASATGVIMLENVRFFKGEDSKDKEERMAFAQQLTAGMDLFINDAFADYRASASSYDVATILPSYLGPVFLKEVKELAGLANPVRPMVAIIGGSKLSEKLDALLALLEVADKVCVGGAMRYTLFKAQGIGIGNSRVENDKLDVAKEILSKYADKLVLPTDHMIISKRGDPAEVGYEYTQGTEIPEGHEAIDIGLQGIELFKQTIATAKTIVRNGPVGVFEFDISAKGTEEVGKAIAMNTQAYKLAGGGDSIAAINKCKLTGFNHISTGGGAMLAFLAYEKFPTLDVIVGR